MSRPKRKAPDRLRDLRDQWTVPDLVALIAHRLEDRYVQRSRPSYVAGGLAKVSPTDLKALDLVCSDLETIGPSHLAVWASCCPEVIAFAHRMALRCRPNEELAESPALALDKVERVLKLLRARLKEAPDLFPVDGAQFLESVADRCEGARKRRKELEDTIIRHPHADPTQLLPILDIEPTRGLQVLADGGLNVSEAEARRLLTQAKRAGEVLPMYGCGNPCPRASDRCGGFDASGGGCGGFVAPTAWWRATGIELEHFAQHLEEAVTAHGLECGGDASPFGRVFALCLEVAGYPRLQLKAVLRRAAESPG